MNNKNYYNNKISKRSKIFEKTNTKRSHDLIINTLKKCYLKILSNSYNCRSGNSHENSFRPG